MEDTKEEELDPNGTITAQIDKQQPYIQPSNVVKTDSKKNEFLDLGWGLESIDVKNPYKKSYITLVYTIVSFLLVGTLIMTKKYAVTLGASIVNCLLQCGVFGYCIYRGIHKYIHRDNNTTEDNLTMAVNPVITRENSPSPVSVSYGFDYKETQKRKLTDVWINKSADSTFLAKVHDFLSSFDSTFHREDDPISIRPYYFRFTVTLYGVISSIYTLGIVASYSSSPTNICNGGYSGIGNSIYELYYPGISNSEESERECTQNQFVFESIVPYIWWVVFSSLDVYQLTDEYYDKLKQIMKKASERFDKSTIIEPLRERAEEHIYNDVKLKMVLQSNIQWLVFLFVIYFVGLVIMRAVNSQRIFFATIFFPIIEALVYANITIALVKICILSKYPLTVNKLFGESIYCESTADILAWWQLRHIFQEYKAAIYMKVLSPVIIYGFIFIVVLPFWAILSIFQNAKSHKEFWYYPIQFSTTIVLIIIVLYCMKQFVAAYGQQMKHIGMLQKEVIRLQAYQNHFATVKEIKDVVKLLSHHMKEFDAPISIAGIPMTNTVFIILKGAASSLGLLVLGVIKDRFFNAVEVS